LGTRSIVFLMVFGAAAAALWAAEATLPKPRPADKCPVCGMFVAKYPDWLAAVVLDDGAVAYFDGVKDMMKFVLDPKKYSPRNKAADIRAVFVTDYYTLSPVDGRRAFYVIGSDVYGPMGKELIPFAGEAEAREFLKDHKGRAILVFGEIGAGTLRELD
jgi:nitrous oxide reductase accessory protein NosL